MQINWKHIQTLNGSQTEGFEEFASQLARRETMPKGAKFTRKGKPDAGIECYWTLLSGDEVVWQAKYFLSQEGLDWSQVDGSIKTALDKHPRLVRYYVCIPVDLPDARLSKQKSAFEKWKDHVKKWKGWAAEKGMSVEFEWWGGHEMLEKLSSPANAGLARFWFDAAVLDPEWFDKRLQEAIDTAGPRYTKEINVKLPIVADFDAFGRTAEWVSRLKRFASQISKVRRLASYDRDKLGEQRTDAENVFALVETVIAMLREISVEPTSPVSFKPILDQIGTANSAIHSMLEKLSEGERLEDEKPRKGADRSYRENPFRSTRYKLYDVQRDLGEAAEMLGYTETLAQSVLLLLNGAAGMGKTHLFCDLALKRQKAGLPTVLLMGQRFVQPAEPWTQALQQLDLAQWSAGDFVGALECVAQAANARVLVMIDALNEGAGRAIWPDHMSAFLKRIASSPWIAVAVSVRSSYEELVLPASVIAMATRVTHEGFADHEYDASKTFFKHYGIELPSTPLLAPEYRSPLFLKSICLGLQAAGHTRLPRGFHGITQVFQLYTGAINSRLAKALDFDEKAQLVQKALKLVVDAFPSHRQQWLSRNEAIALVDGLLPGRTFQSSLYQNLVGEGLLVENLVPMGEGVKQELVYLGYERLADHFTAEHLLEKVRQTPDRASEAPLTDDDKRLTSGVLESLFIQAPETLHQELLDFAPPVSSHWHWPNAYRQSLIWRSPEAFTDRTLDWFNDAAKTQAQYNDKIVEKFSSDLRRLLELKSVSHDDADGEPSELSTANEYAAVDGKPPKKTKLSRELVHVENKELALIVAKDAQIRHIKLVLNRFESNKIVGKLQTALRKYVKASKCTFVEPTVSLVVIGPKQLANGHSVDELTLSRAKHRILAKKVGEAAGNMTLDSMDQKTFDAKMEALKALRPTRGAAVDGIAESFRDDWRTALACEKELADEASTLHYSLEQGRRTLLAKIQMQMYASDAPWEDLPDAVELAERIFGSLLGAWWGDLKSTACRGEVARLIGECPIGWDGLDVQNAS